MKAFWAALIAMIVISAAAGIILDSSFQKSASQAHVTTGTRLGN